MDKRAQEAIPMTRRSMQGMTAATTALLAITLSGAGCVAETGDETDDEIETTEADVTVNRFDAFTFLSGRNGRGRALGIVSDDPRQILIMPANGIPNDEASSLIINGARAGTAVYVFDSRDGFWGHDDYAVITVLVPGLVGKVVPSFEQVFFNDGQVQVQKFGNGNLDGKVSRIEVY